MHSPARASKINVSTMLVQMSYLEDPPSNFPKAIYGQRQILVGRDHLRLRRLPREYGGVDQTVFRLIRVENRELAIRECLLSRTLCRVVKDQAEEVDSVR